MPCNQVRAASAHATGSIANMRKYVKKASRVVYELTSCPTLSNAPATVRYMFNYKLAEFSPATCKKATELQSKLTTTLGKQTVFSRYPVWRTAYLGQDIRLRILGQLFEPVERWRRSLLILITVIPSSICCLISLMSVNGWHELFEPHSYR
jgi:hypothetical protein